MAELPNLIFSKEHDSKTNATLDFPFPGFTSLETNQKFIFYVILWSFVDPLEILKNGPTSYFFCKLQTDGHSDSVKNSNRS